MVFHVLIIMVGGVRHRVKPPVQWVISELQVIAVLLLVSSSRMTSEACVLSDGVRSRSSDTAYEWRAGL